MIKQINFKPYSVAEVTDILEDGSYVCNLSGDGISDQNIVFPPGNPYLELTIEEIEEFISEKKMIEEREPRL